MIYEYPTEGEPIRQGDIFFKIPRVEISLKRLLKVDNDGAGVDETSWSGVVERDTMGLTIIVPVVSVCGIVITQDCDCVRSPDITLCEMRPFVEVHKLAKDTKNAKGWVNVLTQHARINLKWFYLPPDNGAALPDRMGVDFSQTIRLPREELEGLRSHRKARLNSVADEHFRERLSEYFRRYPYDEWYPLNKDELDYYRNNVAPDALPFSWQQT